MLLHKLVYLNSDRKSEMSFGISGTFLDDAFHWMSVVKLSQNNRKLRRNIPLCNFIQACILDGTIRKTDLVEDFESEYEDDFCKFDSWDELPPNLKYKGEFCTVTPKSQVPKNRFKNLSDFKFNYFDLKQVIKNLEYLIFLAQLSWNLTLFILEKVKRLTESYRNTSVNYILYNLKCKRTFLAFGILISSIDPRGPNLFLTTLS